MSKKVDNIVHPLQDASATLRVYESASASVTIDDVPYEQIEYRTLVATQQEIEKLAKQLGGPCLVVSDPGWIHIFFRRRLSSERFQECNKQLRASLPVGTKLMVFDANCHCNRAPRKPLWCDDCETVQLPPAELLPLVDMAGVAVRADWRESAEVLCDRMIELGMMSETKPAKKGKQRRRQHRNSLVARWAQRVLGFRPGQYAHGCVECRGTGLSYYIHDSSHNTCSCPRGVERVHALLTSYFGSTETGRTSSSEPNPQAVPRPDDERPAGRQAWDALMPGSGADVLK